MRGAQPDVECARCGARWAPTFAGRLVTCATCGLVFEPHEVQHRARRSPGELAAPLGRERLERGVWMTASETRLDVARSAEPATLGLVVAATSLAAMYEPRLAVGTAFSIAILWLNRVVVTIEDDELWVRERPIPLRRGHRIPLSEIHQVGLVRTFHWLLGEAYDVRAELRSGHSILLVRRVHAAAAATIVRALAHRIDDA